MRRAKQVQSIGLIRLLRRNEQAVEIGRTEGCVVVRLTRSWLRKQRLRVLAALLLSGTGWAAPSLSEQRAASALFTQVNGCIQIQTLVQAFQNEVQPQPDWPDGWARAAWITVEELDTCTNTQHLNVAGELLGHVDIDRKLSSATINGTVLMWDGVSEQGGVMAVDVRISGTGPLNHQVWRTLSRSGTALSIMDGFGLQLRNSTMDAKLSVTK